MNIRTKNKGTLLLIPLVLILIGLGFLVVSYLNNKGTTYSSHTTGGPYTKGITSTNRGGSGSSKQTTPDNSGATTPNNSQSHLLAPWGTYANVYQASENEQMESVCNTTPGANCTVVFTQSSVTRSLPTKTTDNGGATYWSWTPASVGLTPGTWHLTMTATLDSQSLSSSDDPLTLTISS